MCGGQPLDLAWTPLPETVIRRVPVLWIVDMSGQQSDPAPRHKCESPLVIGGLQRAKAQKTIMNTTGKEEPWEPRYPWQRVSQPEPKVRKSFQNKADTSQVQTSSAG